MQEEQPKELSNKAKKKAALKQKKRTSSISKGRKGKKG